MSAITGAHFVFPTPFRLAINRLSPLTQVTPPESKSAQAPSSRASWRALVEEARRRMPGQHIARVVLPSSGTLPFLVMFSPVQPTPGNPDLTSIYLEQYTGEVVTAPSAERSAGDIVIAWLTPLHVGNFGGNGIRVIWLLLGMAPPVLFATGVIMWWTRVVRVRWIRASRPAVETAPP